MTQADKPRPSNPNKSSILKNKILIIAVVLLLVIGLTVLVTSSNNKSTKPTSQSQEAPEEGSKQTEAELGNYKYVATVFITKDGISPEVLRISKDTRIIWLNKDKVAHKIAITPGTTAPPKFYDFRQIEAGNAYSYVINQTVTFHYYVVDHPTQNGTVIVK